MNRETLKKYLRWDEATWGKGLQYLLDKMPAHADAKGLELGSNYGGISVCLVAEKGYNIICSDIEDPEQRVLSEHPGMKGNAHLSFDVVDGLNIKYPANSFDLVIFKSVLGHMGTAERQNQFINEIYRVLKPGGAFYFLENGKASGLHQFARKKFVTWGSSWRYVSLPEMKQFLSPFKTSEIKTTGFFTAFAKSPKLRRAAYITDTLALPFVPASMRYVMYGYAIK